MERRFFINEFEQSLKEHADNFQMVPSKKVWHGIYNDLHPGKRWPSVTMSLLLIFTLVVIGHLNTNNSRKSAHLTNANSNAKDVTGSLNKKRGLAKQRIVVRKTDLDKGREAFVYSTGQSNNTGLQTQTAVSNYQKTGNLKEEHLLAENLKAGNNLALLLPERNFILSPQTNYNPGEDKIPGNLNSNLNGKEITLQNGADLDGKMNEIPEGKAIVSHFDNPSTKKTLNEKKDNSAGEELSADKNIGNISSVTKTPGAENKVTRLHKKRNDKIAWVYFAAPVVSTVSFSGEPMKEPPSTNSVLGPSLTQKDNKVLHNSALGLEAGAQMNYTLTKKLKFITGIHLTYSGYNIISNEVHPTFAILWLRNPVNGIPYSNNLLTHYGDGTGEAAVMIRNYNWQVSMPFGLQFEVSGNNKLQFNVGANLEPSLVLKSNAYILSSDRNNYVNDPAILRKWNMSSNFGAFVTFKSDKFKWQIGPNVRYQWLSTYQKDYSVKEHLIDYGIRIGISK